MEAIMDENITVDTEDVGTIRALQPHGVAFECLHTSSTPPWCLAQPVTGHLSKGHDWKKVVV